MVEVEGNCIECSGKLNIDDLICDDCGAFLCCGYETECNHCDAILCSECIKNSEIHTTTRQPFEQAIKYSLFKDAQRARHKKREKHKESV